MCFNKAKLPPELTEKWADNPQASLLLSVKRQRKRKRYLFTMSGSLSPSC